MQYESHQPDAVSDLAYADRCAGECGAVIDLACADADPAEQGHPDDPFAPFALQTCRTTLGIGLSSLDNRLFPNAVL